MKILIVGEHDRRQVLREKLLQQSTDILVEVSDGDADEDFDRYDLLFDLNMDDDNENFPIYASLKEKPVFVSALKQSLAEMVYTTNVKVRCRLFGINALPYFLKNDVWEISLYRRFETPELDKIMQCLNQQWLAVEDRVGLVKARVIFMIINEACYALQEGTASIEDIDTAMKLGTNYPFGPFEWCDLIGITHVFETLHALYQDTGDERYRICPLLKHKYLRNETFYRTSKMPANP
ncbi:MAG: 3-hydroxyacyl-CoA dehydrogenase family protein [Chitinophagales bacterium]|nr:3-hydroxyacyl-CoA dehydrogenase family protein [Chitinophagales bacterium]